MASQPPRRMLHTMLRVGNLTRSVEFYTRYFDLKVLRVKDFPEDEFSLVFLGHGSEISTTVIELTYNYGKTKYEHGGAYGHICFAVPDVKEDLARMRDAGVEVTYESDDGFMGFVKDPDGYEIEVLHSARFDAQVESDYDKGSLELPQVRPSTTETKTDSNEQ
jgi:lactoylglutathione lyase